MGDVGTASLMVLTTWKHCPKWHLQLLLLESQNKEETFTGLPRGEGECQLSLWAWARAFDTVYGSVMVDSQVWLFRERSLKKTFVGLWLSW